MNFYGLEDRSKSENYYGYDDSSGFDVMYDYDEPDDDDSPYGCQAQPLRVSNTKPQTLHWPPYTRPFIVSL